MASEKQEGEVKVKLLIKTGLTLLVGVGLLGCGSPLFNHVQAADKVSKVDTSQNHDQAKSGNEVAAEAVTPPVAETTVTDPATVVTEAPCPIEFAVSKLCAAIEWVKNPSEEEKGEFTVKFWKKGEGSQAAGPFVDPGYAVGVKLWMPDMGHGSSPVKIRKAVSATGEESVGIYSVTEVYFVMGGDWEIWVILKQGTATIEKAKIDIKI